MSRSSHNKHIFFVCFFLPYCNWFCVCIVMHKEGNTQNEEDMIHILILIVRICDILFFTPVLY